MKTVNQNTTSYFHESIDTRNGKTISLLGYGGDKVIFAINGELTSMSRSLWVEMCKYFNGEVN